MLLIDSPYLRLLMSRYHVERWYCSARESKELRDENCLSLLLKLNLITIHYSQMEKELLGAHAQAMQEVPMQGLQLRLEDFSFQPADAVMSGRGITRGEVELTGGLSELDPNISLNGC